MLVWSIYRPIVYWYFIGRNVPMENFLLLVEPNRSKGILAKPLSELWVESRWWVFSVIQTLVDKYLNWELRKIIWEGVEIYLQQIFIKKCFELVLVLIKRQLRANITFTQKNCIFYRSLMIVLQFAWEVFPSS